ncbi:Hypothetical predicted protein [Lecanosticta acicola]|uniref:Heterokaryon incompatibility domain-containing protein n=1 Tax=Lecanosticta acicola TaxID=111012 RepID=A0AAI8Z0M6_9PEZI|nr:Hypothetical predicted protein [Lecanosticta acicola]
MDRFEHTPLPRDGHHIRLVRFRSVTQENSDEPLTLSLMTAKLSDQPVFNALSYEWGHSAACHEIIIDGRPFMIRENLYRFLRVLSRSAQNSLPCFTDAICINQEDLLERNAQVQAIGEVYSGAAKVLVWLGPSTKESDFIFDLCNDAASASADDAEVVDRVSNIDPNTEEGDALDTVYQKSYWTRLWIIQELFLARDAVVFCGEKSTLWSIFQNLSTSTKGHFVMGGWTGVDIALGSTPGGRHARSVLSELRVKEASQRKFLDQLLLQFGRAQCLDVRDRVFGLLGIAASRQPETNVQVDYSLSSAELFVRVLQTLPHELNIRSALEIFHILRLHHDLDVFSKRNGFLWNVPQDKEFRIAYSHIGTLQASDDSFQEGGAQRFQLEFGLRQRSMVAHGVGPLNYVGPNDSCLVSDDESVHQNDSVFLLEGTNLVMIQHADEPTKDGPFEHEPLEKGAKYSRGMLCHSNDAVGVMEAARLLISALPVLPVLSHTDDCWVRFAEGQHYHVAHETWNMMQVVFALAHLGMRTEYWDRLE